MTVDASLEVWPAIERLGGWAVVVWIVVWLTKRWEVRMDTISSSIAAQTAAITRLLGEVNSHRLFSENALTQMSVRLKEVGDCLQKVGDRLSERP